MVGPLAAGPLQSVAIIFGKIHDLQRIALSFSIFAGLHYHLAHPPGGVDLFFRNFDRIYHAAIARWTLVFRLKNAIFPFGDERRAYMVQLFFGYSMPCAARQKLRGMYRVVGAVKA